MPGAGGNVELEDRDRLCRLLTLDQEPDCHLPDPDLFARACFHRRLLLLGGW
jgi:hypothetical protein